MTRRTSGQIRAEQLADTCGTLLAAVRDQAPLVQCVTNTVVTGFTANVLLALGAVPAMVDIPEEAGAFAGVADGVLLNLGTPSAEQRAAMREAAASARGAGTPWVLDPVAIGSLPVRTALAHDLAAMTPTVVRANASETLALTSGSGGGRGVEATDGPEAALIAARPFARDRGIVVAVSGPTDLVTDGERTIAVANGHPLLTRVTGAGCALGAVVAAFCASAGDRSALEAATAAHVVVGIAAERAAARSAGPGSFAVQLLDALDTVDQQEVADRARISVLAGTKAA
jgi:hydroxyethylthiazole kinase